MPKPAITKRTTKGAALTYAELDTNFQNIVDATVTMSADSGSKTIEQIDSFTISGGTGLTSSIAGSTLTINLDNTSVAAGSYTNANITVDAQGRITAAANGAGGLAFGTIAVAGQSNVVADSAADTLTLIAGSNITLTTNATNDSVTIAAAGTSLINDTTPTLGGNLNTNNRSISNSLGRVLVQDELTVGANSTAGINIGYLAGGSWRIESNAGLIIACETTFGGSVVGPSINLGTGPNGGATLIGKGLAPDDKISLVDVVRIRSLTTTQRTALANPQSGDMIYNSTTNKFQGYANGVWVDFH